MNKEKKASLTKYLQDHLNKLSSPVPPKHKNRETQYRQYLEREIATVKAKLEAAKLEGVK